MNYLYLFLFALLTIIFFGLIVLVHEFGHYIVAKSFGVRVDRFAFGLPFCGPVIYRKKIGETEFIFHLLFFLGGYLTFPDSNPFSDLPLNSDKRLLNKTNLQKALINLAGPITNIIASLLIIISIGIIWKFIPVNNYEVKFNSFKETASEQIKNLNLKSGDVIYSINGKRINDTLAMQEYLRVFYKETKKEKKLTSLKDNDLLVFLPDIYTEPSSLTEITIIRDGQKINIEALNDKTANLGLNIHVKEIFKDTTSFKNLIKGSFECLFNQIYIIFYYLKELITGQLHITDIRGLISVIKINSELCLNEGLYKGLWFLSFISINMAIINLMPIPIFDGGKLLIILSGDLLHKKMLKKKIAKIMIALFKTFNVLTILILLNDIFAIITKVV